MLCQRAAVRIPPCEIGRKSHPLYITRLTTKVHPLSRIVRNQCQQCACTIDYGTPPYPTDENPFHCSVCPGSESGYVPPPAAAAALAASRAFLRSSNFLFASAASAAAESAAAVISSSCSFALLVVSVHARTHTVKCKCKNTLIRMSEDSGNAEKQAD